MEFTTSTIPYLIATGLVASILTLGTKLVYDGIKAKKNGGSDSDVNKQISVNLALLTKDVDFNNKILVGIKNGIDRLAEHSVTSNIHLMDLKTAVTEQTHELQKISGIESAVTRLEDKVTK
ncbi:MAG: hypothetical protein ACTSV7_04505 [Candidatus Baldrarchaeia archaeon]